MQESLIILLPLVALLVGIAGGKAWERYKLRNGRWIDRRRLRDTPHSMLGLNYLADHRVDLAIEELTQAISSGHDALELHMILGNLYREKGQVGRAVNVHESLLQRRGITALEHAYVMLCLGLDFRHGGFIDRAIEAFTEVLRLDPSNRYALLNLQKLYEEQHQWAEALRVRQRLDDASSEDLHVQGFLRYEIGRVLAASGDFDAAAHTFDTAIQEHILPAFLALGDVREQQGDLAAAAATWERLVEEAPERAYLAFDRLERLYRRQGRPQTFLALCRRLIERNPQDWRARVALSHILTGEGQPREAFAVLLAALPHNPHGQVIHQAIVDVLSHVDFDASLVDQYVDVSKRTVFYLDPHMCVRCRYRSTELLWQCPQCHEWNTFVEERVAPARDESAGASPDGPSSP